MSYPECVKCGKPSLNKTPLCIKCTNKEKPSRVWKKKPRQRKVVASSENGHFCIKCGREHIPIEKMGLLGCCLQCHQKSDPTKVAAYYRFYVTATSSDGARSDDPWLDIRMAKLLYTFRKRGYVFETSQLMRANHRVIRMARTKPRGDEFVKAPEFDL